MVKVPGGKSQDAAQSTAASEYDDSIFFIRPTRQAGNADTAKCVADQHFNRHRSNPARLEQSAAYLSSQVKS